MKYVAVIEKAKRNYAAYLPDVPGCVATGKSAAAALKALREALEMHLAGLAEDGIAPPKARTKVELVEVA